MNEAGLKGMLGLCVRAGQADFGEEGCGKALKTGQSAVLILDAGASENTRKRYDSQCRNAGVPLAVVPEGLIEQATGKPGVAMAVRKGPFSQRIIDCLKG
jgi:ribosomal protein L7Ae-like RNA K-turn-binding protein